MVLGGKPTNAITEVIDAIDTSAICSPLPNFPAKYDSMLPNGGVLDGKVIACGSFYEQKCFELKNNDWSEFTNLGTRKLSSAATVINEGKRLFIFGGQLVNSSPYSEYVHSNGSRFDGPDLYLSNGQSSGGPCMVTLNNGNVMVIGGYETQRQVGIFEVETENYFLITTTGPNIGRFSFACTVFNSTLHGNREVVYIGGGGNGVTSAGNKAEILDYTVNPTTWEMRKSHTLSERDPMETMDIEPLHLRNLISY